MPPKRNQFSIKTLYIVDFQYGDKVKRRSLPDFSKCILFVTDSINTTQSLSSTEKTKPQKFGVIFHACYYLEHIRKNNQKCKIADKIYYELLENIFIDM